MEFEGNHSRRFWYTHFSYHFRSALPHLYFFDFLQNLKILSICVSSTEYKICISISISFGDIKRSIFHIQTLEVSPGLSRVPYSARLAGCANERWIFLRTNKREISFLMGRAKLAKEKWISQMCLSILCLEKRKTFYLH